MIPGLDFVAIDFETANPKHASICQIGLVKVRNGVLGKTHCHFVLPPAGLQNFAARNVGIHGITRRMVDGADGWDLMLPRLEAFTGGLPLVAHNVAAERSMIFQACTAVGLTPPDFTYCCTQKAARLHLPEADSYKLDMLVEALDLPPLRHHDAGEDAAAAAYLAVRLAELTGISDVAELFPAERKTPVSNSWKKAA